MPGSRLPFVRITICRAFRGIGGDGLTDHSHHFRDPLSSLHLDLKLQRDSMNPRKIGDINEALQICKQSTQTASI